MLKKSECFIYASSHSCTTQLQNIPEVTSDISCEEITLVRRFLMSVLSVSKKRAEFIAASRNFFMSFQVTSQHTNMVHHLQAGKQKNRASDEPQTTRVVARSPAVITRAFAF